MGLFDGIVGWMKDPNRTQQMQGLGGALESWGGAWGTNQDMHDQALGYTGNRILGRPVTPEQEAGYGKFIDEAAGGMNVGGMVVGKVAPELAARATQMVSSGASPGRILQETGLVKVPTKDGFVWGRQISDEGARIRPEVLESLESNMKNMFNKDAAKKVTLGELLDHPALFKEYPSLADIKVEEVNGFMSLSGVQGFFDKGKNTLGMQKLNQFMNKPEQIAKQLTDRASTVLHEVQHAIQGIENWPRGGNTGEFATPGFKYAQEQLKWVEKSLEDSLKAGFQAQGQKPPPSFVNVLKVATDIKVKGEGAAKYWDKGTVDNAKAILSSPEAGKVTALYERLQRLKTKIEARQQADYAKYQSLAGEEQAEATQKQFESGNYRAPINSFYDNPVESLIYRDPFGDSIK